MLFKATNCGVIEMSGSSDPTTQRFYFIMGSQTSSVQSGEKVAPMMERQQHHPVQIGRTVAGTKFYWWFQNEFWVTSENLTHEEARCLIIERKMRSQRQVAKAKAKVAMAQGNSSIQPSDRTIPQEVKLAVWQRDKGQCVQCGSNQKLEFDHIIPFSLGGGNTARNIQLLCEDCNRAKGAGF